MFTMMFGISKDRFVYDYILSNQKSLQTTEKTKTNYVSRDMAYVLIS